jgi:hypothetical protein
VSKKLRILYLDWIRTPVLHWIRGSGFGNPDPDPGRPNSLQKIFKNIKLSYFEKSDLNFGGLETSPGNFKSFRNCKKKFQMHGKNFFVTIKYLHLGRVLCPQVVLIS